MYLTQYRQRDVISKGNIFHAYVRSVFYPPAGTLINAYARSLIGTQVKQVSVSGTKENGNIRVLVIKGPPVI